MLDVGRRVARFRQQIDEEVADAARKRRLAKRLENAIDGSDYPSIGQPSWREQWRARMAGLPEDYASRLRWVEQLGRTELRVVTKDAREYLVSETRISRKGADVTDIPLMLAFAINMGWDVIIVTGGSPEWRRAVEQAAAESGLRALTMRAEAGIEQRVGVNNNEDLPRPSRT